jgi:23S rRNA (adenine2503-C2)-methyltransferase
MDSQITIVPARQSSRPTRRSIAPSLYDLSFEEIESTMRDLGQPAYRARQVHEALYRQLVASPAQMSTLPATVRSELASRYVVNPLHPVRELVTDSGETIKLLYQTADKQFVESVVMFYPDRTTVCVSCQVGCAVGCAFCATGLGGLQRNLTAGEIIVQVIDAARVARKQGRTISNVVMMGMGEPFHNYDATMQFISTINDARGFNLGARRITVSTSGVVPAIDHLAEEPFQVNLAVSLHAPNDPLRDELAPINKRYPLSELLAAVQRYIDKTGRRVSFEYALMKGINDSDEIAEELANLIQGMLCHVNIIPLNPVDVLPFERPDPKGIEQFAETLRAAGIPATVRYSRGVDIGAACGQLRAQHEEATTQADSSD